MDPGNEYREEILATLHANCSVNYMTLVSIIQSVSLGLLGAQVLEDPYKFDVIPVIATFLMIVLIWEECKLGTTALYWVTNVIDSVLPFVFCACEIGMIYTMRDNTRRAGDHNLGAWCFTLSFLFFLGIFWYLHTYHSAHKEVRNKSVLSQLRPFRWLNPVVCAVYSVAFSILAILSSPRNSFVISMIGLILICLFYVKAAVFWKRIVRFATNQSTT